MAVEDFSDVWPGPTLASFVHQRMTVDFHGLGPGSAIAAAELSQVTPGSMPKPLPVVVDTPQLKQMLGLTSVKYTESNHTLVVGTHPTNNVLKANDATL